ncbi:uncharacterized protein OCT59_000314 [Rhizophagus irregularis]|uniref:F-box domain-containing protein n=2 Tax=Rhizophagus irregularis TaxID=588596 RepID=U9TU03_RHIID|nr:hypothetical protein GLOIN_2v1879309 [Rhizophagus irregularis DAOM 181602=DAOM 197198]EXX58752.1 hypothetical protein RirG_195050 [Rhizophagus irregularis DAOM 197198w]POG67171.1 hypothetical protein GLOIN_2v1879309 [Rhizophagus irregularis DAOM 181602=DAOM 197198]UZN99032.1 hypothetical protein OCT59_000314 [Rhizophagus irregularis]GBC47845.1 hypothetical protein GLOIN_2v1879309 [Rhizophagus irregularis DAOM 181602=DAOM 197198]|eukprot:XP_025174037.1 hypothetical protein GLOIN_2v1879309 [Rhizophagus irregularis DAOM 181602=DAOM 197198]
MACSKLFLGDLPELVNEIIQHFHYDYKTLHSCILVNKLWCHLAIPLLWEDPFSLKLPKNYHFIEIYLYKLNDDYKIKLDEYLTQNDIFPSNTLFNYPSFIQRLDAYEIINSINEWARTIETSKTKAQRSGYFMRNKLLPLQMINFTKLIYKSLFIIFIENEVNLHSFEVMLFNNTKFEYFDEILELILQNPKFICNIKNFEINFYEVTENTRIFTKFLYSNCNSISSLYLQYSFYHFPVTEKCSSLSQIIQSQINLRKLFLGCQFPLHQSLSSLIKNPNCSNTLNTIIFYYVDFKNILILSEAFNHLNVLESIHIIYCRSLDSRFIQQINNITKPFKLKSLFLNEILQTEELLVQKSCDYLENFGIIGREPQQLLQLIIKYCSKIKYLGPISMNNKCSYLLLNLVENITQNLDYLFIETSISDISSIILKNLGQILPHKLEYLHLSLSIDRIDFEIFLKNFQNTFVKKLVIRNRSKGKNGDIFPSIKEYIMKKKRVKYFAFSEIKYSRIDDLFFLKNKVKEFELYDIQVLCYRDLSIDIYDFIKEVN